MNIDIKMIIETFKLKELKFSDNKEIKINIIISNISNTFNFILKFFKI